MATIVRVRDVMAREVVSIEGIASIGEAAALMHKARVTELLVAKRTPDDAWGIITVRDMVKDIIAQDRDPKQVFVYEVMSKPVIAVPASMDIRYAIRLLQKVGVHRAPVEEGEEIVGMLTLEHLVLENDILWKD